MWRGAARPAAARGRRGGRERKPLQPRHPQNSYAVFFFNDTATTEIYTLSLHDALPISIHFAVVFSEAIVGFTSASVSLSGSAGGLAGAAIAVTNPTADNKTFDVAVSGLTGDGTVTLA